MIHESRYWKTPLIRGANWLQRLVVNDDNSESALARAEREVFIGFYAVRKLLPTFKVSPATKALTFEVQWFSPRQGQDVDYFHRSDVDVLFDLGNPHPETRDIRFLCNQVIHSYIFVNSVTKAGALDGFFVSSDTMIKKRLYFFPLPVVLNVFRTVGRDYPNSVSHFFNKETREWEAIQNGPER